MKYLFLLLLIVFSIPAPCQVKHNHIEYEYFSDTTWGQLVDTSFNQYVTFDNCIQVQFLCVKWVSLTKSQKNQLSKNTLAMLDKCGRFGVIELLRKAIFLKEQNGSWVEIIGVNGVFFKSKY
jgi:hypothetical protein